ncbi:MAG TPA: N-acetylneuraminate synthase family protein [Marinagarivorans sp.]
MATSFGEVVIGGTHYSQQRVYIIAEIGANHNQDLATALAMIERCAAIGVNAVKFQSIKLEGLYQPDLESDEFKTWLRAIELDESWYPALASKCREVNVDFLSSPTYVEAISLLQAQNVPAYKIASPQAQANLPLVKAVAACQKPMIISMGYGTYRDIEAVIAACESVGNQQLVLLHCVSQYPVKPEEANLNFIPTLKAMSNYPVGFSDHSLGDELAVASVALGACVLEKHITLDRQQKGPDHKFSLHFDEFEQLVLKVRNLEKALGSTRRQRLGQEELGYRDFVALKMIVKRNVSAGEPLREQDFILLRSNNSGILADDAHMVMRCRAAKALAAGQLLQWSDLAMGGEHA